MIDKGSVENAKKLFILS